MSFISKKVVSTRVHNAVKAVAVIVSGFLLFISVAAYAVPVNVNKADAELIADSLAGIGIKTAQKIVAYRDKNGVYKKVSDLLSIKGIGEKKLDKIKKDIKLKD